MAVVAMATHHVDDGVEVYAVFSPSKTCPVSHYGKSILEKCPFLSHETQINDRIQVFVSEGSRWWEIRHRAHILERRRRDKDGWMTLETNEVVDRKQTGEV